MSDDATEALKGVLTKQQELSSSIQSDASVLESYSFT